MQTTEVLELLLTARYIGAPAFGSMARDIDTLINSSSGLSKVGAAMQLVGTLSTATAIAVADFAVQSVQRYGEYEQAVQRLIAVHALGVNQVGQFNSVVMDTAERFGQNSTDIANGMYVMMSAMESMGYSSTDVFKNNLIPAIGAYVAASGNGLAGSVSWEYAAKDLVAIFGALHVPASQWTQVMGDMTVAENNAGITQDRLVQAMLRAAPTINELGGNYKDLITEIAAMGTAGVIGARAGTELASGLRNVLTSAKSLAELKTLGLGPDTFFDKSGNLVDPTQSLGTLYTKLSKLSREDQFKAESVIFGATGNRALGQLLMTGMPYMQNLEGAMSQNVVSRMFGVGDATLGGLVGAAKRLRSAVDDLMKVIGGPLAQAITPVIDKLANLLSELRKFLMSPQGTAILAHAPAIAAALIGGGLTAGPALQAGGGALMNWAGSRDEAHHRSKTARDAFSEERKLERSHLEERHALAKKNMERDFRNQLKHADNVGVMRTQQAAKMARFEEKHGLAMQQFDALTQAGMPGLEPSAFGAIGGGFKNFGKDVMKFGHKFSPEHAARKLFNTGKLFRTALGEGDEAEAASAKLAAPFLKMGKMASAPGRLAKRFGGHVGGAWAAGKELSAAGDGSVFTALKGFGGKLFEPLTMGLKGFIGMIPGAIGGIASFGAALLPIIAIVLLVVGAIAIAVLIFLKYRKQAEELGSAILNALLPVFNWLKTVVLAVLKSIQDAWHAHAKEVDAAMKKLFPAIQGIIPVIQAVGAVIAFIFGVIIVIIGALVNAFIAALPFIINVFTGIFNAVGALWRFFDDIVHLRFGKAIHDLMDLFHALWDVITNLFGMLGTFIYNSIAGALSGLGALVMNAVSNIPGGTKLLDFLGIHLGGTGSTTTNNGSGTGGRSTKRAGGGVVRPGELTVTGEKGWEFAHFPAGTRIYSHQQSMAMLHAVTHASSPSRVQVDVSHSGDKRSGADERHPGRLGTRSPAEEYFFARRIQEQRESIWDRYPNRSRQFDSDYHRAYQYYG